MDTTRTDKTTEVSPPEITLIPPDIKIDFKNNRIEFEFDNQKINAPVDNLEAVLANEMKLNHWKKLTKCCFRNNK